MRRVIAAPAIAGTPADAGTLVSNPPNPARLYQSLRDSGYSNDAAVADLVDNCVDAGATQVRIFVEPESGRFTQANARVIVSDDGIGMSMQTLAEAMKLGSDMLHDLSSDLGKYGMGLITAAISMGRRLVVLTKPADGKLIRAVHDLDIIGARNAFVVELGSATERDERTWSEYAVDGEHGTVVLVEKCDSLSYVNAGSFTTQLKKRLGQIFRLFIMAKSKKNGAFQSFLTINGTPVYAVDPLMLEENKEYIFPRTLELLQASFATQVDDFTIDVPIDPSDATAGTDSVRVRVVNLPELGQALSGELGINATNSGIYVMRNQREIAPAQTLGVFNRAQALTGFRAELHVPATLDKRIGLNWSKQRVEPDSSFQQQLQQRLGPHVSSVRKRYQKSTAEKSPLDHKAYETLISKKAKLLTLPKTRAVVRDRNGTKKGAVTPKETSITRTGRGDLTERFRDRCEFREANMTAAGPLWEPDMEGSKIIITFNTAHPLWARFVLERDEGEQSGRSAVVELLHLVSFCLTTAEFSVFGEEEFFQRLVNMRQQLSNNMRVLLT